uniref:Uncharacterized protein n=1 Tax=Oryza sativa subsp. japonica TaxID=39947 RepID=Q6Z9K2_ORYSJ|nr:hypothetical protein [Oryza sativa Japonica Group]
MERIQWGEDLRGVDSDCRTVPTSDDRHDFMRSLIWACKYFMEILSSLLSNGSSPMSISVLEWPQSWFYYQKVRLETGGDNPVHPLGPFTFGYIIELKDGLSLADQGRQRRIHPQRCPQRRLKPEQPFPSLPLCAYSKSRGRHIDVGIPVQKVSVTGEAVGPNGRSWLPSPPRISISSSFCWSPNSRLFRPTEERDRKIPTRCSLETEYFQLESIRIYDLSIGDNSSFRRSSYR